MLCKGVCHVLRSSSARLCCTGGEAEKDFKQCDTVAKEVSDAMSKKKKIK